MLQVARLARVSRPRLCTVPKPSFSLATARFSTENGPQDPTPRTNTSSNGMFTAGVAFTVITGAAYFYFNQTEKNYDGVSLPWQKAANYYKVYEDIARLLESNPEYDDGSFGPILVRLAWHAAGTYDKDSKTGGSNGASMRFNPEASHGANAGLKIARDLLEPIKSKYPGLSYSDLWSLAGVVAIQEMGGPIIPWRPGRQDAISEAACTPDGRLPDASQTQDHLRNIFYRMGFNDQEIVALSGAHALGRCHTDRSGFDGPWTRSPITFSNDYFKRLLEEQWVTKKWKGPKQYVDKNTQDLMMLPSDLALIQDKEFKKYVQVYAKDEAKFFADFGEAFTKLLELGVSFDPDTRIFKFNPTD